MGLGFRVCRAHIVENQLDIGMEAGAISGCIVASKKILITPTPT